MKAFKHSNRSNLAALNIKSAQILGHFRNLRRLNLGTLEIKHAQI